MWLKIGLHPQQSAWPVHGKNSLVKFIELFKGQHHCKGLKKAFFDHFYRVEGKVINK